jgi:alpha-glucosidase
MSEPAWWRDAVVYQIYVRSFADSNGDGVGDLPGITSRLPYLAQLGVDALWLTPFYQSPMADHGYDVADQCAVDPLFGTLEDADLLLETAHALGLRVIVDLVPNHSSDQHAWFQEALADPSSPMRERYLFRPGRDGGPPNNWESVFGLSAWTQTPDGAWYLHLFDTRQPDFDWRHPAVHEEWERILRFWLDRGADGFRIDVAHGLYKQAALDDNPPGLVPDGILFHASTMPNAWDQPEVLDVYRRWRQITEEYPDRVMVGEVFLSSVERVARFVGPDLLHQSFNFPLLAAPLDASVWQELIAASLVAFELEGASPTWVLSNHDVIRHATRYGGGDVGRARAKAATLTLLGLPGSPYLYQGEELGLEQDELPPVARQDPIWIRSDGAVLGRDGCRTPLPWTAHQPGHGFTDGQPWLPIGSQAQTRSIEAESGEEGSHLSFYRQALDLRRGLHGALDREVRWRDSPAGSLCFARTHREGGEVLVALNTGTEPIALPPGRVLIGSGPLAGALPPGVCAWLRVDD